MPTPQRLKSLFTETPIYFVTACTYNRRSIFRSARCARGLHSIRLTRCRLQSLCRPLRDHARSHTRVCWFCRSLHVLIVMGEIPQKHDLQDLDKREFSGATLATWIFRSRNSI